MELSLPAGCRARRPGLGVPDGSAVGPDQLLAVGEGELVSPRTPAVALLVDGPLERALEGEPVGREPGLDRGLDAVDDLPVDPARGVDGGVDVEGQLSAVGVGQAAAARDLALLVVDVQAQVVVVAAALDPAAADPPAPVVD